MRMGEFPVASEVVLEVHDMEGAVHGFQVVVLPIHFHGGVHVLLIEAQVSAGFPQVGSSDVRGIDEVVAALAMLVAPEVFCDAADQRALWMPYDEAWAGLVMDGEEVELLAQDSMVAFLGFFDVVEALFERFLGTQRLCRRCVGALVGSHRRASMRRRR